MALALGSLLTKINEPSRRYRAPVIESLDLGVAVLQRRRSDGRWRVVDRNQLADETAGRFVPSEDEWVDPDENFDGVAAGQTYVYGHVGSGVPESVTAGGRDIPVQQVGCVWAATWEAWRQRIVVHMNGEEQVLDLSRLPHYLEPD
jgi:hypothetical protein